MNSKIIDSQISKPVPKPRVQIADGFTVTKEFHELLLEQMKSRLDDLSPNGIYTAKQLAGDTFWGALDNCERRIAGRCIVYMVGVGLLSLKLVKGLHEYPLRYQPK